MTLLMPWDMRVVVGFLYLKVLMGKYTWPIRTI